MLAWVWTPKSGKMGVVDSVWCEQSGDCPADFFKPIFSILQFPFLPCATLSWDLAGTQQLPHQSQTAKAGWCSSSTLIHPWARLRALSPPLSHQKCQKQIITVAQQFTSKGKSYFLVPAALTNSVRKQVLGGRGGEMVVLNIYGMFWFLTWQTIIHYPFLIWCIRASTCYQFEEQLAVPELRVDWSWTRFHRKTGLRVCVCLLRLAKLSWRHFFPLLPIKNPVAHTDQENFLPNPLQVFQRLQQHEDLWQWATRSCYHLVLVLCKQFVMAQCGSWWTDIISNK